MFELLFQVYLVQTPLATSTLLGYDATSFPHLDLGISTIPLCRSSKAVRLDGFQVFPEMFDLVQIRALAGLLKIIHRVVPETLPHCVGCVLRIIVLLEGNPFSPV